MHKVALLPRLAQLVEHWDGKARGLVRDRSPNGAQKRPEQVAPVPVSFENLPEVASGESLPGSSPAPRTTWPTITWAEKLGRPARPYLKRWVADFGSFTLRIHRWYDSDDLRNPHDHEWCFVSWLVAGDMVDRTPGDTGGYVAGDSSSWVDRRRRKFIPEFFSAEHRHSVVVGPEGAWTFMLTGHARRPWGFWTPKRGGRDKGTVRFRRRNKYFREHGHHG